MHPAYCIHNAVIVNEGRRFNGGLLIRDHRIEALFRDRLPDPSLLPQGTVMIDAGRKFLIPGVIDDHVHFREPGLTDKGDMHSESRAAVAGGITSVMEMPNTRPPATTLELLEEKFTLAAGKSLVNFSFFLGAANDNLAEIEMADPSRICGMKLFLGASTGNMLVDDPATLDGIFSRSPLLIVVHAEDEAMMKKNLADYQARFGTGIPPAAHPLIRSSEACFLSSEKAVELARRHGARLHLAHLSTAAELDLLQNDRPLEEKRITGEVCVHHLWFDDRDYDDLGTRIKWNPAIKSASDRESLLQAVIDGRIDLVATDHAPHLKSEKERPYTECPSGGPLVQHALVAMFGLHHLGKISVETLVEKMCHAPARLYRIPGRGFIREGAWADLALVDPDDPWTVEPGNILYKCGWSPFEGVTFRSRVTHTWVNGHLVYDRGRFDESVKGRRLEFERK